MQANITYELKDKIIQWQITVDMDVDMFLRLAKKVHEGLVGKPIQKVIEHE